MSPMWGERSAMRDERRASLESERPHAPAGACAITLPAAPAALAPPPLAAPFECSPLAAPFPAALASGTFLGEGFFFDAPPVSVPCDGGFASLLCAFAFAAAPPFANPPAAGLACSIGPGLVAPPPFGCRYFGWPAAAFGSATPPCPVFHPGFLAIASCCALNTRRGGVVTIAPASRNAKSGPKASGRARWPMRGRGGVGGAASAALIASWCASCQIVSSFRNSCSMREAAGGEQGRDTAQRERARAGVDEFGWVWARRRRGCVLEH